MTEMTPHPGSRLDATAKAAEAETPVIAETPGETGDGPGYLVGVRNETPSLGVGNVVLLTAASPVQLLLPQDPRRRSAVVLAVDNDVYLATSKELAEAAVGATTSQIAAYLPAGIGVPIDNRAAWYAAATTTATNSRITVIISKDEE